MARSRKPAPPTPRQAVPGDVYLLPLPDGRLGACRMMKWNSDESLLMVAASPWVGAEAPDLAEPQLQAVLRLTHHNRQDEPCIGWVFPTVPEKYPFLGQLPVSRKEAARYREGLANWDSMPPAVLAQWRWDHERDAVLAEEEAERRKEEASAEEQRWAYKPWPAQTLEEFRRQTPFADWSGYVEAGPLRGSRRIIRDAVDALIELGPDAPVSAQLDVFRLCIERFNDLDGEDHFINTIEREDICEVLDRLGELVDLDDYAEELDSGRDW
jgi:hypothetical protein